MKLLIALVLLLSSCVPRGEDGITCSTPDVVEFPDGGISAMTCERE